LTDIRRPGRTSSCSPGSHRTLWGRSMHSPRCHWWHWSARPGNAENICRRSINLMLIYMGLFIETASKVIFFCGFIWNHSQNEFSQALA
jgi:hypothetical protein